MYNQYIEEEAKKRIQAVMNRTREFIASELAELELPSSHTNTVLHCLVNTPDANTKVIENVLAKNIIAEIVGTLGKNKNIERITSEVIKESAVKEKEINSNKESKDNETNIKPDPLAAFLNEDEDEDSLLPEENVMRDELFKSGYTKAHDVQLATIEKHYKKLIGIE